MRLYTMSRPGRLEPVEVADPEPAPHEIRVRVACVGICGSDIEVFEGRRVPKNVCGHPVVGHEVSGIIDRLGAQVSGLARGDSVAVIGGWGALGDYVITTPQNVLRFPPRIDLRDGCLLEVLPGVMMAATRTGIGRSTDVLVVGQGLSGLLLTRIIHLHGCRRLVVVDPDPEKLRVAQEFGASMTYHGALLDRRPEMERANPSGFDVGLIATPDAACIADVVPLVRPRGRIVFYGGLSENACLDLLALHHRSLSLIKEGECINGVLEARSLWRRGLRMACDGLLPLRRLRSHVLPMSRVQEAFELRASSRTGVIHVVLKNEWVQKDARTMGATDE